MWRLVGKWRRSRSQWVNMALVGCVWVCLMLGREVGQVLSSYRLRADRGDFNASHARGLGGGEGEFLELLPDQPRMLLILSYQRCGSTFFGDIFGNHPDVIYTYEPLDGVYISLYGTMEGWNVPSDITNFKNGSQRTPTELEQKAVTEALDDLLNCRITSLPVEVLAHKFYQLFKKENLSAGKFLKCSKTFQLSGCRRKITKICSHRFFGDDPDQNELCYKGIHEHTTNKEFIKYQECLKRADKRFKPCVEKTIGKSCAEKPFRAVKTVRATMHSVEKLIQNSPNLRIVHLLRDPRAVVLSRSYFDASSYGFYSTLDEPGTHSTLDVVREARLYCSTVVRDVRLRQQLEITYPGRFWQVIYDKFVLDPTVTAQSIYDFIGVDFSEKVRSWLRDNTWDTSIAHKQKWQKELTKQEIREIDEMCQEFYSLVDIS